MAGGSLRVLQLLPSLLSHPGPNKKLEDTKGVIRCHKWKKDRQDNGQNKKEK
jgi:hypothetical protein